MLDSRIIVRVLGFDDSEVDCAAIIGQRDFRKKCYFGGEKDIKFNFGKKHFA